MANNRTFFKQVREGHMSLKDIFSDVLRKHSPEESAQVFIAGTALTTPREEEMLAGWQKPFLFARFFVYCALVMVVSFVFAKMGYYAGMDILLVLISLILPMTLLILVWEMNIPRDISLMEVIGVFAVGGIMSLLFTAAINAMDLKPTTEAMWAPVSEEPAKLLVVFILLMRKNRKYILDGMLLGMAVGTGFAVMESLNYIFNDTRENMVLSLLYSLVAADDPLATLNSWFNYAMDDSSFLGYLTGQFFQFGFDDGMSTGLARGLGSLASHGTYAALYSGALMIAKGSEPVKLKHLFKPVHVIYFAVSFLLHMANNSLVAAYIQYYIYEWTGFGYGWQVTESIVMMLIFFPLLKKGVNQVVDVTTKLNGGRVTIAVNRESAGPAAVNMGGAAAQPLSSSICVEFVAGPYAGKSVTCQNGQKITFGRVPGRCDIALTECPSVSGTHCTVAFINGMVMVTDQGSSNGTYLGGQRLAPKQPVSVPEGSMIYLGGQSCAFRVLVR